MGAKTAANLFHGKAILLAEDNRVNSEITAEILQQMGCEVVVAENGQEAVSEALSHQFDLILMDCHMPIMDGFKATRRLRQLMSNGMIKDIPIIALTGTSQPVDLEASLMSGMSDVMLKPARKDTMAATLRMWLEPERPCAVTAAALKERRLTAMSIPTDLPAEHFGVDTVVFELTRAMLGDKFIPILRYYLEDANDYVARLEEGLQQHDIPVVRDAAYALRSSSRQIGIMELAYFADRMEISAQRILAGEQAGDLHSMLYSIQKEMGRIRPFIAEQCGISKAA
jgi:CheY-like chemotaxis protein